MNEEPTPLGAQPDDDPTAALLRGALGRHAQSVEPSPDGLSVIRSRIAEGTPRRAGGHPPRHPVLRWVPLVAAAAAVAVVGGLAGLALGGDGGEVATPPAATSSPSPTPAATPSPTPSPAGTTSADPTGPRPTPGAADRPGPVYWVGASKTALWLYREYVAGADTPQSAVEAMTTRRPADPDFTNPWRPASAVAVVARDDLLTVDLSADAFRNSDVGSELAQRAVQQLVWTVTAAAGRTVPVRVLVDGEPGYEAWGSVVLGEPMERDPAVRAPIWVIDPQEGSRLAGPEVSVTGSGHAYEGTITYEITRDGAVVDTGFVTTRGDGVPGDFSFTVTLEPGTYTITAYADDASSGESPEGPRLYPDSKTFTVTGTG